MKSYSHTTRGWINGFIGVAIFSGSLPATKAALIGFSPDFLTASRAAIAGLLSVLILILFRQKLPNRQQIIGLSVVALGVVVGFPFLTALALKQVTSAHSMVFLGLLPLSTAIFGVLRGGERPHKAFWFFSVLGSLFVMGFAYFQGGNSTLIGDLYMLAAVLVCGLGYAEGAKLSKHLGSWQVICWALVISLPIMLILCLLLWPDSLEAIPAFAWGGLGYVALFSMLIGFFFWYSGLAEGGIAGVSQLQLLQPFMGLMISAWILNESINTLMVISTIGVIICVIGSKRFSH
ncbi:DMT family transporter [Providencia stuartii]|uniref:DMT family transporter n=1 Tax=Providencia TaxID=586 RepID=UPI0027FB5D0F|nr:DMT family transporter [Providencia sp. 2023EL-00965]ELR5298675.1 DMT family transporter [Providencia stuartii]MDW7587125.1 DMT family transporter [Providencia sp. 2023EL-00965]